METQTPVQPAPKKNNLPMMLGIGAAVLLRSKYGNQYIPPPASGTMFADVPSTHWAAAWIEELAHEGISSGCDGMHFCPDGLVTRAQIAVFLVRTFNLP